jgi:hypothetical protein
MAKPTEYAPLICVITSILAVIGIIASLIWSTPLPAIILLFPTVAYEIYRTEGASTKISSVIICLVLFLELILIITKVDLDLGKLIGEDTKYIAGYEVPLGLLSIVGPTVIAVLSVILFVRTYGIFTKWLAVVIFITSLIISYTINPPMLGELSKFVVREALDRISYL